MTQACAYHRRKRLSAANVDFIALWVFAGRMRVPHQIVQGCVAVVLAMLNFIMRRHWVSTATAGTVGRIATRTT
jgi:hypothetical protein